MNILKERVKARSLRILVAGHSWITGDKPPRRDGWVCTWVNHFGVESTEFVYRRRSS